MSLLLLKRCVLVMARGTMIEGCVLVDYMLEQFRARDEYVADAQAHNYDTDDNH